MRRTDFGHFENLLPPDQLCFTPREVAAVIGRSEQYVRDCFDSQAILGHCLCGRGRKGRRVYQVSRSSLLLYLLETANFTRDDFTDRIIELLNQFSQDEKKALAESLTVTQTRD